ncbi:hypothetical protein CAEBREN_17441 [Caenorhabditis brenneri]|uniref:Uncharacterized protein n=1 Tax=Caenorhabditis brenneri TaxID=135651 RepID=G0N6K0_CAEBE|nr:hypothetical protein CAEBREN_17441 [Caenorhabditis brenneri]
MEIRLQSEFRQDATVTVTRCGNETVIALPIGLHAGKERRLGAFPIEFSDYYDLSIVGGRVEKLGISKSIYTAHFEPTRGTMAPQQLYLPFNGFELIFECDENWSGPKCDVACGSDCNVNRQNLTMELSTDYTVDMTKLPEIVKRLKETTKVDNQIRKKEEEKKEEKVEEKEEEDTWKRRNLEKDSSERPGSIFADLFKTILSLKDRLADSEQLDENPIQIKVKMNRSGLASVSTSDTENDTNDDVAIDSESPFGLPMDPMSMIQRIMEKKREKKVDNTEEFGKHSYAQKLLGMKHDKPPSRFNIMDGPGGMPSPFGPLMSMMPMLGMMPRIVRHTPEQSPHVVVAEGSGVNDFDLDQIIKTRSP